MIELFNEYVQSIETYVMFRIKQAAAQLKPGLEAKNRAPIFLSMGAPVQAPPKFVVDRLKEALDLDGLHTYSSPKGEDYYRLKRGDCKPHPRALHACSRRKRQKYHPYPRSRVCFLQRNAQNQRCAWVSGAAA